MSLLRISGERRSRAALVLLVALAFAGPVSRAEAFMTVPVPNGYTVTSKQQLSAGLLYVQYRSTNPRRIVNVAFAKRGGPDHFRMVLSNERVAGPLPRTEVVSSMCKRVKCRIAVNGDFFSNTTGQPAGGMAAEGLAIRTPPDARYHFAADWGGNVTVRKIALVSRLYATYPNGQKPFYVHSFNTARASERMVVYSPKWGPSTETSGGYEVVVKVLNPPVAMDKTLNVRIVKGVASGNNAIPADGLVVSGVGGPASELWKLWRDVQAGTVPADAQIMLDSSPNLRTYTGGTPPLLVGGKQAFVNDGSSFITKRDPKTMVGRRYNGDAILAVVDGRQPSWSVGMSMTEAMQFMRSLGAVEALNLDGGGSSTFVKNGVVINKPSDGRERSIAAALTLVP